MGEKDYAIVVGVSYADPELNTLQGPLNDAKDFHEWVCSKDGGNVPTKQAKLILSSEVEGEVEPTADRVNEAINELYQIAAENEQKEEGFTVGRRLYLYLAGHGIAPDQNQTAVLMADATRAKLDLHILGQYSADCIADTGMFGQVLLFLDCCREQPTRVPLLNRKLRERSSSRRHEIVRFYGNASHWKMTTREHEMEHDGLYHGIFTTALLSALKGAAANRDGVVTAGALHDYLINFTKCLLTEEERLNPGITNEPHLTFGPKFDDKLVIAKLSGGWTWNLFRRFLPGASLVQKRRVRIMLPATAAGMEAVLLSNDLKKIASTTVKADSLVWELELEPGLYVAWVPDDFRREAFQVGCGEVKDVSL